MYLELFLGLLFSYFILFILSLFLKDNSIVDIFWGLGFLQITIHSIYLSNNIVLSQILLFLLILVWSFRISYHILIKRIKRGTEDIRYANWRKNWNFFYLRSIFQIYLLQCILLFIISSAIIFLSVNLQNSISIIFILGFLISISGLLLESISDIQLQNFLKNPKNKGKIMMKGLWKYSRHPNYLGESIFWLGISILAFKSSYLSLISYLTITFLLRYVSGVPMAEKNYLNRDDFKKYCLKTPPFIPSLFNIFNISKKVKNE